MSTNQKKMPLIYVAGPYRAHNGWKVHQNVRRAEAFALKLWQMGFSVICPHKNTENFDGVCLDEVWLEGDLEQIRRCDAIVMLDGWKMSHGSIRECDEAIDCRIPIFYEEDSDAPLESFLEKAQGNQL